MGNCGEGGNTVIVNVGGCETSGGAKINFAEYVWNGEDSTIFVLPEIPKDIDRVYLNGQKLRTVDYSRLKNKVTINYELFPVTNLELKWSVSIYYFV